MLRGRGLWMGLRKTARAASSAGGVLAPPHHAPLPIWPVGGAAGKQGSSTHEWSKCSAGDKEQEKAKYFLAVR